jgi:hypothetical protein
VFGYINRNRRLGPVLEALAGLAERNLFRLDIYGELWDPVSVAATIERLGLDDIVHLRGFLPEQAVPRAFADADLASENAALCAALYSASCKAPLKTRLSMSVTSGKVTTPCVCRASKMAWALA